MQNITNITCCMDEEQKSLYIIHATLRMKKKSADGGAMAMWSLKEAFRASLASRLPWLPGPPCGTGAVGGPPAPATGGAV